MDNHPTPTLRERPREHMALTVFMVPGGYFKDSWRMPGSRAEEIGQMGFLTELVQMAEAAKLDAVFFGDSSHANSVIRGDIKVNGFYEPIATLSALAQSTTKIGLAGTMSTSFYEPYNAARLFAGLDHVSGGRAAWNVVTSFDGHANFGKQSTPDPATRYARATEFMEVVVQLWDAWADDAIIVDRESGWWIDPERLRRINHVGEHFRDEGPLPGPRSPQGRPVIAQAGSSGPGIGLGTSIADLVYTAQPVLSKSIDFYASFKSLVRDKGREPDHVKIIPGILPIIGDTMAEAEELAQSLADHVHLENGRGQLSGDLRMDLSELDFTDRIPEAWFDAVANPSSRAGIYRMKAVDQGMTLGELIVDLARSTGHQAIVGTPSSIADTMVAWFEARACDGFNFNPPHNPDGMRAICEQLVPELQERGCFREEYEGDTLRDHLGIPRPSA